MVIKFEEFEAHAGMIITTAEATPALEKAVDELSEELGKPVVLIAGGELVRFVLKFGGDLLA